MTTGGYNNGSVPLGIQSSKSWSGTDGKYTASNPPMLKWNDYSMIHRKVRFSGSRAPNCSSFNEVSLWHPVTGNFFQVQSDPDYVTWACDSNTPLWTTSTASSIFNSMWTSSKEIALLAKLLAKVKEHQFNIGVSLAEVDKLTETVVGTIKNIGLGAIDLYSGHFANFARRFGASPPRSGRVRKLKLLDVSGRFLEMRYAWLPAIEDCYQASLAFEQLSRNRRGQYITASGKAVSTLTKTNGSKSKNWPNKVRKATRKYICHMYESMSATRQMGLGNPASILWERIPWSFVVDWFIPIGTYLELIGQVPFISGRFLRMDLLRQTVSGTPSGKGSDVGSYNVKNSGNFSVENNWFQRTALASLSVPRPSFKVQGAVQGGRILNAVALTHQVMTRLLTKPSRGVSFDSTSLMKMSHSILLI